MFKLQWPKQAQAISQSRSLTRSSTSKARTRTRTRTRTQKPPSMPRQPIPFLDDLKQLHDPDEALSLFNNYTRKGFKHHYPSYSSLLYKLARSRNFHHIDPLLRIIKDRNIQCQESMFTALMQHYGKCQLVDKAVELFHQMPSFNCERTIQSFNTLLNVFVTNERFSDANDFFLRSRELGFRLNSVSFNIMIKGWLKRDELENACQVFDEMLDREIQPTVVTYNSLIGFLCKKGDVEKAMRLLDDVVRKGNRPNAGTYALLMQGLCSLGKYNEAKKMMFDMEYQGCKPRHVNFGVLMTDLTQRGKLDEAQSLFLEMKKKKLKPDVVMYNILVNYFCKEGRVEEAYKVLVDMQMKGCEPNAVTYRMLVDGFCQVGEYERGLGVLHSMLMSRHCPRLESFCCLVMGLIKCGKTDDASFVLEEMGKRRMRIQHLSWESLVRDTCYDRDAADKLVPFAKPNGAVLPSNNGGQQNSNNNNNNNIPFLTGLGGFNPNVMQNNNNNGNSYVGGNGFPVVNGAQFSSGSTLQKLMFGTMMAIDDQLTEGHELGSGMVGKAQGFYIFSSVDGNTQTVALTAMFQEGGYVDSLNLFGVHQTAISESQFAVMGGTGKYVNAKGFATVKTLPPVTQQTDGLETVLQFSVFLTY